MVQSVFSTCFLYEVMKKPDSLQINFPLFLEPLSEDIVSVPHTVLYMFSGSPAVSLVWPVASGDFPFQAESPGQLCCKRMGPHQLLPTCTDPQWFHAARQSCPPIRLTPSLALPGGRASQNHLGSWEARLLGATRSSQNDLAAPLRLSSSKRP